MNKKKYLLSILIYFVLISTSAFAEKPEFSLTVTQENCDVNVLMTITNNTNKPLTIQDIALPWHLVTDDLQIILQNADNLRIRSNRIYMINDLESKTTIKPGAKLSGQVELKSIFRDVDYNLVKSDHLLYWHYKLTHENNILINHGSALLKKCY